MKPYVQSNTDIYKLACNFIKESGNRFWAFLKTLSDLVKMTEHVMR